MYYTTTERNLQATALGLQYKQLYMYSTKSSYTTIDPGIMYYTTTYTATVTFIIG
jgi:hypothetical protein